MTYRHMTCCPACKTVAVAEDDQHFLRVAVEIGWFNSGGGSAHSVTLDGLCEPCGDRIFHRVANLLREEAQVEKLKEIEEPALQAESGGDS